MIFQGFLYLQPDSRLQGWTIGYGTRSQHSDIPARFSNTAYPQCDESGGPLEFESIRVGQVEDSARLRFQLIRNVPTRVTLIFQQSNSKLSKTPAIKLAFRDGNDETLTVKFSEIVMR
ncbi:hypothetical protein AB7M22_003124 [Pseudomonas sp. ADAK2 TE3594]